MARYSQFFDSYWRGMLQRQSPRSQTPGFIREALNVDFIGGIPGSRPGLVPFHGADYPEPIAGMTFHRNADGSTTHLAGGISGAFYTCIPGGDPQLLTLTNLPVVDQTRVAVELVNFLSISGGLNQTFIYDGVNQNLKFDGTTLSKMGISTPPTPAAEGAHAAGLVPAGVRLYKQSLLSTTHESDLSEDPRSITSAGNEQYDVPSPVQGVDFDDPQVVTWKLYSTIEGGGIFYFVGEADIGDPITVNVKDVVLQEQGTAETLVNEPPIGPIVALCEHRAQLAAVYAFDRGLIYFSNLSEDYMVPEGWPRSFSQPVAHGDGDELRALASLHEWMVAFKQNATYGIVGESFAEYTVKPVLASGATRQGIGCFNPGTVLQVENAVMFFARDGGYRIDRFQGTSSLIAERFTGAIDELYGAYIFSLGASTFLDRKHRVMGFLGHG